MSTDKPALEEGATLPTQVSKSREPGRETPSKESKKQSKAASSGCKHSYSANSNDINSFLLAPCANIHLLAQEHIPPSTLKDRKLVIWMVVAGYFFMVIGIVFIFLFVPDRQGPYEIATAIGLGVTVSALGFSMLGIAYSLLASAESEKSMLRTEARILQALISLSPQPSDEPSESTQEFKTRISFFGQTVVDLHRNERTTTFTERK